MMEEILTMVQQKEPKVKIQLKQIKLIPVLKNLVLVKVVIQVLRKVLLSLVVKNLRVLTREILTKLGQMEAKIKVLKLELRRMQVTRYYLLRKNLLLVHIERVQQKILVLLRVRQAKVVV